MKTSELKKIIKESVKEAIHEELKDILLEAVKELEDVSLNETIFVLNSIIAARDKVNTQSDEAALRKVLNVYLDIIKTHDNVLAVEGVGVVCKVLGDKLHLAPVLSQILTNVRSDNLIMINTLHHALRDIASGVGKTVEEVITDYVDHLSKDLNLILRRVNNFQSLGVKMLIKIVMKVASSDQDIHDLQDTIDVLLDHLAVADENTTIKILNIVLKSCPFFFFQPFFFF